MAYNVLIVDDERIERQGIMSLIKKYKYPFKLYEAENGKKALEIIRNRDIDVLITDIKMPIMDGIALIEEVRIFDKDLIIIINSAYGEFEYAKVALSRNVSNYILKPIQINEFQFIMEEVIDSLDKRNLDIVESEQLTSELLAYKGGMCINWLISKEQIDDELRAVARELEIADKFLYLISVSCRKSIFEKHEKKMLEMMGGMPNTSLLHLIMSGDEAFYVIANEKGIAEQHLIDFLEEIVRKVKRIYDVDLYIVASKEIQGIDTVYNEFQAIETAKEYLFFSNTGSVIVNHSDRLFGNNYPTIVEGITGRIKASIQYAEFEQAVESVELLVDTLEQAKSLSSIYIKHLFLDIMEEVYKRDVNYEFRDMNEHMKNILSFTNIKELEVYVLKVLEDTSKQVDIKEKENTSEIAVEKVIDIIRKEYSTDIGLEYLAKKVCLSPNYLSGQFKQMQGESIIKYIGRFRLEKSVELLKTTNMKIVDISKAVGFSNNTYFVTVFKNRYGLTPAKYRLKI